MRKLATAAAVSLALASGGAFGLGLGDIDMRSALNQPMNAEIPLTAVKAGELDGMIVKLADEDAFARAGIERTSVLTDLDFTVDSSGARPVIRVTSRRAVTEPFLNFLLEVDWTQGRMVREYTVLLDPPVFMTEGPSVRDDGADQRVVAEADSALVAPAPIERTDAGFDVELVGAGDEVADETLLGGGDEGDVVSLDALDADSASLADDGDVVSLSDLGAPNTAAENARAAEARSRAAAEAEFEVELVGEGIEVGDDAGADTASRSAAGTGSGDGDVVSLDELDAPAASGNAPADEVTVARGDTLFAIAEDNAPRGVSVEQMMLALLEANRSAFINENINLVKAGSILRVPQAAEARALSQAQALAEIGRQDDLWRQYRDNLRGNAAGTRIASGPSDAEAADADADADGSADAESLLSEDARAILEAAREEVRRRDELSIVADDTSAETTASATADETEGNDAARLGEINRKLQLAREELAATRVEGDDLGEQAEELQSTSENLDALVSLRQNEIAKLEAQLAEARSDANGEAGTVDEAAGEVLADAEGAIGNVADDADAAGDAVAGAVGGAAGAASEAVAGAGEAAENAADDVLGDASAAVEAGTEDAENALSAAGRELESVELLGDDSDADGQAAPDGEPVGDAAAAAAAVEPQGPWYQNLLQDPTKLAIAGAGALGLLGVIGTLLWRRRRQEDDDPLAGFHDGEVEFIDDDEAAELQAEFASQATAPDLGTVERTDVDAGRGFGGAGKAAAAGVAGAAAAGAAAFGGRDDDGSTDAADATTAGASADATGAGGLDKDDTISEVDVYLAYGLHGQAEDLLTKAIDRQPENMEYAEKLLQTYHAQGNGEGFQRVATDYHSRFGGTANPSWEGIAAMGRELRPDEALFAAGAVSVAAVGSGSLDGPQLDDEDFLAGAADGEPVSSSVSRDFGAADESLDFDLTGMGGLAEAEAADEDGDRADEASAAEEDLEDETALMDQSLDPAFAFDEGDLEATGDFSAIADELAAEGDGSLGDGSLDFPDFDSGTAETPTSGVGAAGVAAAGAAAAAAGAIGAAGASASDAVTREVKRDAEPGDDLPAFEGLSDPGSLDDALTLDELDLDGSGSVAANDTRAGDDLSLDLDDLTGAIDLDATSVDGSDFLDELSLDASSGADGDESSLDGLAFGGADELDGLEIPDLTGDDELLNGTGAPLGDADEMDTMMDLAKAYIDMGDKDSASNALGEIVKSGNPEQVSEAETLLRKIS